MSARVIAIAAWSATFLLILQAPSPAKEKSKADAPVLATGTAGTPSTSTPPEGLVPASEALGEDVLALAKAWNGEKYARPASTFRSGGVRKLPVDKGTVDAVGGGFRVRFASGSQVTTPAVYDGTLFVSGGFSSHELYAFDARTGKPVWALALDDDGPSAPACAQGVCVVNTESCTLFVVEAKTGKLVWSKWLGDPLMAAATISGNRVFAAYPAGEVVAEDKKPRPDAATHVLAAFELKTGKVLWQRWIDGDVISSPVASGDRIWAATFSGTVYEFDKATGKIRSAHRSKATSAPVVVAGNLFFSKRDDQDGAAGEALVGYGVGAGGAGMGTYGSAKGSGVLAVRKKAEYLDSRVQSSSELASQGAAEDTANGFGGGAPAAANADAAAALVGHASVSTLQAHQGSRIVALKDDRNVATMGDEVVCTDGKTGKRLWTVKIEGDAAKQGGHLATAPVAVGGSVLVGTAGGEVLRIDEKTGTVVKRWKVGGPVRAQPVVQDGWIYAGTADGRLIAIDTGDKSLTGWTQWGGDAERSSIGK